MPRSVRQRWQGRASSGLFLAAALYGVLTLIAQWIGNIPPWFENSPVELSTDVVASCGLVWTLLQLVLSGRERSAWMFWLTGSAAMSLIWAGESAADAMASPDYRLIIAAWALAACGLIRCLWHHALRYQVRLVMQFGLLAQCVAHVVWALQDGWLQGPDGLHPRMELITDSGELTAILCYLVALILSRASLRDDQRWQRAHRAAIQASRQSGSTRLRVCFPYIAQRHQMLHSLPIAAAIARQYPDVEVHVAAATQAHLDFARRLIARHVGGAPVHYQLLYEPWESRIARRGGSVGGKKMLLRYNRDYFAGFDAVVTPERTSTYLRRLDIPQTKLIGTEHGAGDREVTFAPEMALFDFLLLPGDKQGRRLIERGYLRAGHYVSGIYSKFDWTLSKTVECRRLFDNDRLTVLYNPHFAAKLSSWPLIGWQVLDFFARSDRYNLVFAPHVRLFDAPTPAKYRAFQRYQNLPHIKIDLGSDRCIDMSYTLNADLYLGDVSSQVVEFLIQPRPCVFLNPRRTVWRNDPNYRFWQLGPVIDDPRDLDRTLEQALQTHELYRVPQLNYLDDTLGAQAGADRRCDSGARGAEAIVRYLSGQLRA